MSGRRHFFGSAGQLKGRALGALALGGGAVAAAHLDGRQGAAAAGLAVIGAAADAALNVGVAGLIVIHSKNPPKSAFVCNVTVFIILPRGRSIG